MDRNEKIVNQYRGGKKKLLKALLGEVVRITDQRADMSRVTEIMEKLLNGKNADKQ